MVTTLPSPAAIFAQPPPGWKSWRLVMTRALKQAWQAGRRGEAPIGAVVIDAASGRVLAEACNSPIASHDPTAHAEMLALRQAGAALGNYRLAGAILAVTLEPCLMCLGAMVHARIGGLVFGARDPKAGAVVSNLDGPSLPFLNHRFPVLEGVLAEECGATLFPVLFVAPQGKSRQQCPIRGLPTRPDFSNVRFLQGAERYRSGRNGPDSKSGCGLTACTWVRIPPSPPSDHSQNSEFARNPLTKANF